MPRRLTEAWDRYWFSPAPAFDLGLCRALACGWFFYCYVRRDFATWGDVPDVFWMPTPFFELFGLSPAQPAVLQGLALVWLASLLLGCAGLFTRASLVVAAPLAFYLLGLPQNFGKVDHPDTVVPLVLAILALSRAGDAVSIDALRRGTPAPPSGAYRWPVRSVWLVLVLVFGAGGLAKLRTSGLAWATSENMRHVLLKHHYGGFQPVSDIGLWIADHPWLYKPMAAAALACEALAPLAMVSRVARALLIPALAGMLLGFYLTLGFSPRPYYVLFAFFVPWSAISRTLRPRRGEAASQPGDPDEAPRGSAG